MNLTGNIATISAATIAEPTSTTIWQGGWVTDNFETYYLDKNHKRVINTQSK